VMKNRFQSLLSHATCTAYSEGSGIAEETARRLAAMSVNEIEVGRCTLTPPDP
jgi:hypothetical protein